MYATVQTPTYATPKLCFMLKHPIKFVFLSVEAFRKLTPYQKQQYVEALKQHLDLPIRAVREEQSHSPAPH